MDHDKLTEMITKYWGDHMNRISIGIWGLAEPGSNLYSKDVATVINNLLEYTQDIKAHDPNYLAIRTMSPVRPDINYVGTKEAAIQGVNALVVCSPCDEFRNLDFKNVRKKMGFNAVIFDGVNLYQETFAKNIETNDIKYLNMQTIEERLVTKREGRSLFKGWSL